MSIPDGHTLFTSESVTEGHPDKMCDQVSDAVLDAILAVDPKARVACETAVKTGFVMIAGEITSTAHVDYPPIIRKAVNDIGFDHSDKGFDGNTCAVLSAVASQSADIALGVDHARPGCNCSKRQSEPPLTAFISGRALAISLSNSARASAADNVATRA